MLICEFCHICQQILRILIIIFIDKICIMKSLLLKQMMYAYAKVFLSKC